MIRTPLLILLATASLAQTYPEDRRGFEFAGGLGGNVCVADGDADCDEAGAGPALSVAVSPGWRARPACRFTSCNVRYVK